MRPANEVAEAAAKSLERIVHTLGYSQGVLIPALTALIEARDAEHAAEFVVPDLPVKGKKGT